ncbi:MAG: alpha/beta hydrolase [Planctomycetes bacterium]|nr:alpha/beta hydrolase [Planctomycetota bacterium]
MRIQGFVVNALLSVSYITATVCISGFSFAEDAVSSRVIVRRNINYGDEVEPMHRGDIYCLDSGSSEDVSEKLATQKKFPAVLLIHGGAWTLGDKVNDTVHARYMASRGLWVMTINYRLAPRHPFPAQLEDCRRAMRWIVDHADEFRIDPNLIGVWGYSAGGHLAALLALDPLDQTPSVKACVSGGTPFDLTRIPRESGVLKGVFGGTLDEIPSVYRQASPITHVDQNDPPMFLFHGTKDWLVPEDNCALMRSKLRECDVEHVYLEVPEKGHLSTFVNRQALEESTEFLIRYLKSPKK